MFHEVSSEPIFAAAFSLWALLVVRAWQHPTATRFALAGLGVALLALIRPGTPYCSPSSCSRSPVGAARRQRLVNAGAFLAAALVPLVAWAVLNGFASATTRSRAGGNAVIPFYRAYITDKIVKPDNGPASRRLAMAVRRHLVTRNPYKGYGVTVADVFRGGSPRIHEDFYLLSDEYFGWDTNYSVLRKAGIEAVRTHPGTYASGVSKTVWLQLSESYFRPPPAPPQSTEKPAAHVEVKGRELPAPTEGQPDSSRAIRLDLASGQLHPRRLDLRDRASLHVLQAGDEAAVRADSATPQQPRRRAARRARGTRSSR